MENKVMNHDDTVVKVIEQFQVGPPPVAESTTTNLDNLVSDTPKDVTCFHAFVPMLPSPRALEDGTLLIPPMAIQVTIFPNSGFAICINFRWEGIPSLHEVLGLSLWI
ncbi:hypothetical protein AAHE18_14G228700 [Arachis hypogaea]